MCRATCGRFNCAVVLKTALSVLTGGLVGVSLLACQVRLAMIFGLLSFLLNYIPNVGSIIAMMLPLPIIWLDDSLTATQQLLGTVLPMLIQGYVGNFLEPAVFGSSLNVTALSVLAALVFWSAIWGLQVSHVFTDASILLRLSVRVPNTMPSFARELYSRYRCSRP
eukprot:SAG31_NODE_4536_length_3157_cov_5.125899_1_plen_166_part_00